jgi:hypothetical protein
MWAAPALGGNGGAVDGFSLPAATGESGTRGASAERSAADDLAERRIGGGRRRARARR